MPADPVEAIETRELTRLVNRTERPRRALTAMLFPDATHRTLMTETVQVDELTGEDELAPFIEVNGEAVNVSQNNGQSYTFATPMISVKRPLTAQQLLFERRAGSPIVFSDGGTDVAGENAMQQIADDLAKLEKVCNKREEWMVAQALTGSISYSIEGKASFSIDMRKPAGNTFAAPNGLWNGGSPDPRGDIKIIQRLCNTNEVGSVTDAIGDSTAADALDDLITAETVVLDKDASIFNPNTSMIATYAENGMRFIGVLGGVRFWEYNASYKADGTGTVTTFIRAGYFEFVQLTQTAQSNRTMFYGRIPDLKAMREGLDVTKRLARVIEKEEPSVLINILKTRPLPWFYRADENVSMSVV